MTACAAARCPPSAVPRACPGESWCPGAAGIGAARLGAAGLGAARHPSSCPRLQPSKRRLHDFASRGPPRPEMPLEHRRGWPGQDPALTKARRRRWPLASHVVSLPRGCSIGVRHPCLRTSTAVLGDRSIAPWLRRSGRAKAASATFLPPPAHASPLGWIRPRRTRQTRWRQGPDGALAGRGRSG